MKKDIVVVGSVGFDTLETPTGSRERVLGGSLTHFVNAATRLEGLSIGIIGVVGNDFSSQEEKFFSDRNVDLTDLQKREGKTFFWHGSYQGDMNEAISLKTELNVFGDFKPEISPENKKTKFLFLGNIAPELQMKVLDQIEYDVCFMDTMNFWLESQKDAVLEVMKRVQGIVINDGEAALLTGKKYYLSAAPEVLKLGPDYLILKKGSHGVACFGKEEFFCQFPAFPVEKIVDPTGAGDSFAGGLISYLASRSKGAGIEPETLKQALAYATIIASFNVEGFGIEGLDEKDSKTIRSRFQKFREFSSIPNLLEGEV